MRTPRTPNDDFGSLLSQLKQEVEWFAGEVPFGASALEDVSKQFHTGPVQLLEMDFFTSVRYVPCALLYVYNKCDEYREVARAVVFVVFAQRESETHPRIREIVTDIIGCILANWSMDDLTLGSLTNEGKDDFSRSHSLDAHPIDTLLDVVYDFSEFNATPELFEKIIGDWLASPQSPIEYANVFAFVFRVRCAPSSVCIYRSSKVRDIVFDSTKTRRLSEKAFPELVRLVGYAAALRCREFDCTVISEFN